MPGQALTPLRRVRFDELTPTELYELLALLVGAQVPAQEFYERLGFAVSGPGYDEDGIPHVPMRRG